MADTFDKLWFIYNQWQNTWEKGRKSSKIGQDYKSLISAFAQVLINIAKS